MMKMLKSKMIAGALSMLLGVTSPVYCQNPPLTPAWALGHIAWEDSLNSQEGTLKLVNSYLEHGIPVNGVIIDSPWSTSYNDFLWDSMRYEDPSAMADRLKELGVKPILWLTGNINCQSKGMPVDSCHSYDYAVSRQYGINRSQPSEWWKGRGIQIDFTNPKATQWWYEQLDKVFNDGFYGFKVDQGEVYFGEEVTTSVGTMSNTAFRQYYYNAMFDYVEKRKPGVGVILARPFSHQGGFHASVDKMSLGWCGDFGGDWDGLKLQIDNIYRSAMNGYGACGTEIAGFMGAKSSGKQLVRYAQFGAMTACMINGGENGAFSNHLPWWHGYHVADIYRYCVCLHNELIPYIFSSLVDGHIHNEALLRDVSLQQESHCLGRDIFTKALTSENDTTTFMLPDEGEWIDFFSGDSYPGGEKITRDFKEHEFPLFIRKGGIIPLDIRTDVTGLGNSSMEGKKSFLIYPGGTTTRLLHLPAGEGTDYEDVEVSFDEQRRILHFQSSFIMDCVFIIKGSKEMKAVKGCSSWSQDPSTHTLIVTAKGKKIRISLLD